MVCYLFTETVPTLEKQKKSQPLNLMAIITSGIYSTEDEKALQEISNILPHSYLQKEAQKVARVAQTHLSCPLE